MIIKEGVKQALKDVRPFIATPCYGGQVTSEYLQSIVYFSRLATEINLKFQLFTSKNESLVTRARNRAVASFLKTDATHLVFIDSDIGFNPFDVFRMLLHDVEVVCASYPMKGIDWEFMLNKTFTSVEEIKDASIQHVINSLGEADPKTGLLTVKDAGTGFMFIKRSVIESMIEAHPEWSHDMSNNETWSAVFDCEIEDGQYLSEDYTFCRRWQRMGGTVWLDPEVNLTHTGSFTFGVS